MKTEVYAYSRVSICGTDGILTSGLYIVANDGSLMRREPMYITVGASSAIHGAHTFVCQLDTPAEFPQLNTERHA